MRSRTPSARHGNWRRSAEIAAAALAITTSAPAWAANCVDVASSSSPSIEHHIAPTKIDQDAKQDDNKFTKVPNEHFIYLPRDPSARQGNLFLFIGGTNHFPTGTEAIMRSGVAHGYHGISLAYANYDTIGSKCTKSTVASCSNDMREEIITGKNVSDQVEVDEHDALEPRLKKLLAYLQEQCPNEGWGRYLNNGEINWPLISVAGHSQGAGHTAWLAKHETLRRAVQISGVADVYQGGPAPWLSEPNVTPLNRQYGFSNTTDPVVPIVVAKRNWETIGLDGPLKSVDLGASAPYDGSHQLTSSLQPRVSYPIPKGGINAHVSMIGDETTPRDAAGNLKYEPVWAFMIFP